LSESEKVYQTIVESFYGISIKDVEWILSRCITCRLSARNEGKPAVKPIKSEHCLDRLVIDLMDFRSNPDGNYKWILQMKDHFSRFVWIYAMKDKESVTVGRILRNWFYTNGNPKKCCCDNGTEFHGYVKEVCTEFNIRMVRGRAYHPQSQGSIAIANRTFKSRLSALQVSTQRRDWAALLTEIAYQLNTTQSRALH
jgi:hypothetical protein